MIITKRNGKQEEFSSEKILKVLDWACKDLKNVEPLEILMQAKMKIRDGIKASKIQETLIRSSSDLISIKTLDYQFVASRLLSMHTRKQIFGNFLDNDMPKVIDVIKMNIEKDYYDPQLLTKFSSDDMEIIEKTINHSNDNLLTYAQYRKIIDSYVMKDRDNGYVYETPQYMFIIMSMAFSDTVEEVIENYNSLVSKSTSYATPILAGVRTTTKQFASCVLIDIDDSVESMGASNYAIMRFIAKKAGLGINFGRWRGAGSKIRNGEVVHTGIIPILRISQASVKAFSQGGLRGGSATTFYPCWSSEFEQLIVLKNDKGTEDNRLKGLDYCIQLTGTFVKKMLNNETISLFSTSDVPDLYEAWGQPNFDELYEKYVSDKSIPRKEIKGKNMIEHIAEERQGTGRYYIMFMDNVNKHSRFDDPIYQSNLCFTGDTMIAVADGRNAVRIDELAKESNSTIKFPVYSARKSKSKANPLDWKTEIKNAVAFKTGTQKVVNVLLSNGDSFRCTEEHLLATTIFGEYVKAKDSKGVYIEPFFTFTDGVGKSKYRFINSITNAHNKQHRLIWENNNGKIEKGYHIDHIENDFSVYDSIENLQKLTSKEHRLKTSIERIGSKNTINRLIDSSIANNNYKHRSQNTNNSRFCGIDNYELIEIGKKIFLEKGNINYKIYQEYINENSELKLPKSFSKYRFGGSFTKFFNYSKGVEIYDGSFENFDNIKMSYDEYNKETQKRIYDIKNKHSKIYVVDVIETDEIEDVYDLHVEDNHNFYIITSTEDSDYKNCQGVLVHNCMEVVEPTKPINHIDDEDGEIALCNLGAVNLGVLGGRETFSEMRKHCHLLVKNVDKIISIQEYPVAGAKHQSQRRSLGIGVTNFAYWMAKNHYHYNDPKALPLIDELFEHFQYYLIEGSMLLAKEIGRCGYFHRTKWSRGYMPIDDQNENARDLVGNRPYSLDWEYLRSEVAKYGLRNSVLSALMPVESSSLVTNSTNGIEPPRDLLISKGNETSGFIKIAVPEALELAEHYTSCWDVSNSAINKIVGVMQMWVDQAISVNHYYNPSLYKNSMIPKKEIIKDMIEFWKYGGKNLYYSNTLDSAIHNEEEDCTSCKV